MAKEGLGNYFDVSVGASPADLTSAATTGNRVSLKNAAGCTILFFKTAGTAGDDPTVTLKEHTAATGGTSQSLAAIDKVYVKSETSLDGDETWTKVTQAAGSTYTDATSAEVQAVWAIEVDADKLSDGYGYISLDVSDAGTNAGQYGCVLYVLHGLKVKRAPANLVAPLS